MADLFPPVIRQSFVPAFIYNDSNGCRVYFGLSDYNTTSEMKTSAVQVIIQQQKTNKNIVNNTAGIVLKILQTDNTRTTDDKYYITVTNDDIEDTFKLNQYYKIQIRFTGSSATTPPSPITNTWINNNLQYFSEWSQVALIYGINQPTLSLKNLPPSGSWTVKYTQISGKVNFSDKESLKSYQILLYNSGKTQLLQDSGVITSTTKNQINYLLKYNVQNTTYKLQVIITTTHLYTQTIEYTITYNVNPNSSTITYTIEPNNFSGSIKMTLLPGSSGLQRNDTLMIRRTSISNNYNYWEQVDTLKITKTITRLIWEDFSVEPGILYKYQFIKNNEETAETAQTYMIYPQDIFLAGDGKQLKVRYDPQIGSMSIKTSSAMVETIGSVYPYIRQNGNIYYRTFDLAGTITHFMDVDRHLFTTTASETNSDYLNFKSNNNVTPYNDYIKEREFREEVIKFLYANDIKLFRSLTQGNILVKLTDVSLTPNTTLGRMIYSFSAHAVEIDECNCENYLKYNVVIKNKTEI